MILFLDPDQQGSNEEWHEFHNHKLKAKDKIRNMKSSPQLKWVQ